MSLISSSQLELKLGLKISRNWAVKAPGVKLELAPNCHQLLGLSPITGTVTNYWDCHQLLGLSPITGTVTNYWNRHQLLTSNDTLSQLSKLVVAYWDHCCWLLPRARHYPVHPPLLHPPLFHHLLLHPSCPITVIYCTLVITHYARYCVHCLITALSYIYFRSIVISSQNPDPWTLYKHSHLANR